MADRADGEPWECVQMQDQEECGWRTKRSGIGCADGMGSRCVDRGPWEWGRECQWRANGEWTRWKILGIGPGVMVEDNGNGNRCVDGDLGNGAGVNEA